MRRIVSEDKPLLVQGDVLSINAEATYWVWLARILEMGDGTTDNQWWVELDKFIPKVYKKVAEERNDSQYVNRLNEEVVKLLAHYRPEATGQANETDDENVDMDD